MKERVPEMQKSTLAVIGGACFLVLCFVTFLNTYRMILLEADIVELRMMVQKCTPIESLDVNAVKNPSQYITRRRRNALDDDDASLASKDQRQTQNISKREFYGFKVEGSQSPNRESTLNTIPPNLKGGTPKKPPTNTRTSRIMHFDEAKGGLVKQPLLKSLDSNSYSSSELNAESSEFEVIRDEEVVSRRSRPRMQTLDERHPRTGRIKPLPSIHLSGDTSRYDTRIHENYNGNGRLQHLQNIFVDWIPSSWVDKTGMMSHFGFEDGYLTVRESGLYFIYAQIYYLDEHDVHSYKVNKNDHTILQCTVSLHSLTRGQKGNTCYTAGVEYVAEGDRISLGDIITGHYSVFAPAKSFFGVVKLGDVRARI